MPTNSIAHQMLRLLTDVVPSVLSETHHHYHDRTLVPLEDMYGEPKYRGIFFGSKSANGTETECNIGIISSRENSQRIGQNKILCMKERQVWTSIEGRDTNREPPFWGGAATFDDGSWAFITGATELQDHLLLLGAAKQIDVISGEKYDTWTSLDHPGIRESMAQFGLNDEGYIALQDSVQGHFKYVSARLKLAA
jgi:hypothetical protein